MNTEKNSRLKSIIAELSELTKGSTSECAIVPGNGPDESGLIGSSAAYIRLATVLLEIVAQLDEKTPAEWCERESIDGVPVLWTNRIKTVFNEFSPTWVMVAYVADDDRSASALVPSLSHGVKLDLSGKVG